MSLRVADPMPSFLVRDAAQSLEISIYEDGALVAPSGGTWALVDTDGSVLAGGSVTVSGSKATYSIAAVDWAGTESYGGGYVEQWALTFTSHDDRDFDRPAYVVPVRPYCPITGADLKRLHGDILNEAPSHDPGFEDKTEMAWRLTLARLLATGANPHEVKDWYAFAPYLLKMTEHLIAVDLSTEERGDGKWTRLADRSADLLEVEWARLGYGVDADNDRAPDTTGNLQTMGAGHHLGMPAGPRRW